MSSISSELGSRRWVATHHERHAAHPRRQPETGGRLLDQREVDRLARPFEWLGAERTGSSGLGLSIVAAVAAAHGGRLALLARPEGGLRVSITLPVARTLVAA